MDHQQDSAQEKPKEKKWHHSKDTEESPKKNDFPSAICDAMSSPSSASAATRRKCQQIAFSPLPLPLFLSAEIPACSVQHALMPLEMLRGREATSGASDSQSLCDAVLFLCVFACCFYGVVAGHSGSLMLA